MSDVLPSLPEGWCTFTSRLEKPAVRAWVKKCFDVGFAHGSDLVMAIDGSDNVTTARDVLLALEVMNWIQRTTETPTPAQQFFDSAGLLKQGTRHYAEVWGWEPNRNNAYAYAYAGGAG